MVKTTSVVAIVVALFLAGCSTQAPVDSAEHWDTLAVSGPLPPPGSKISAIGLPADDDTWELVSVIPSHDDPESYHYFFKRKK